MDNTSKTFQQEVTPELVVTIDATTREPLVLDDVANSSSWPIAWRVAGELEEDESGIVPPFILP